MRTTVAVHPGLVEHDVETPYYSVRGRTMDDPAAARLRACLRATGATSFVRLRSSLDGDRVSGLGSSSSFCVGVVLAIRRLLRQSTDPPTVADLAARAEIELAGQRIGRQDHYAAAYGGLNHIEFLPGGRVSVAPLRPPRATQEFLRNNLWCVSVGGSHDSSAILHRAFDLPLESPGRLKSLARLAELADIAHDRMLAGSCADLGPMLDEAWRLKRLVAPESSTGRLDELYTACLDAGATGGKILGAGRGGYLLLVIDPGRLEQFRRALPQARLRRVPWGTDDGGARIVATEEDG